MSAFLTSKTFASVLEAFAEETRTMQFYKYCANIADIEGFSQAAHSLRSLVELAEQDANGHLDLLRRVGDLGKLPFASSTETNLLSASRAEQRQADELYAAGAAKAREEGYLDIADWLENVAKAKAWRSQFLRTLCGGMRSNRQEIAES